MLLGSGQGAFTVHKLGPTEKILFFLQCTSVLQKLSAEWDAAYNFNFEGQRFDIYLTVQSVYSS